MKPLPLAIAALLIAVLSGCASTLPRNPLAQWHASPNFQPRRPRVIVLHHTAMDSAQAALRVLQTENSGGPVSSHYLIGDDGRLYQLVSEQSRAWHAGGSRWAGISDLNSTSIGIELDNNGHEPFSEAQLQSLLVLLADVSARNGIQPHLVIGHGDIAPTKKDDPSVLFPWQRLADAGFGLWPRDIRAAPPPGFDPWAALRLVGYDLRDPAAALAAFHRHFRGSEERTWQPGDAEILYDLQQQLMELPTTATKPAQDDAASRHPAPAAGDFPPMNSPVR
ncbi:N-acetylmuramoyl-L-alanine amidase [Novilysobacter erysipheiresistens]|uniref:N-acetylmuramoyl-L-alanine amidase n=1 Tax=Novilysobacter erysipheiresistens TaxID=1749332 RepID=A0ABU7YZD2_9GAMM